MTKKGFPFSSPVFFYLSSRFTVVGQPLFFFCVPRERLGMLLSQTVASSLSWTVVMLPFLGAFLGLFAGRKLATAIPPPLVSRFSRSSLFLLLFPPLFFLPALFFRFHCLLRFSLASLERNPPPFFLPYTDFPRFLGLVVRFIVSSSSFPRCPSSQDVSPTGVPYDCTGTGRPGLGRLPPL